MAIAITGVGWQLPDILSEDSGADRCIPALMYRAVRNCLADAACSMSEVDAVVTASVDLWDGKTASNIAVTEAVGAVMKAETRIAGDGLLALMHGAMMVLSGHYQRVLVVAHGKASEADLDAVSNWSFDPVYQQTLQLTDAHALALQSQAAALRVGAEHASAWTQSVPGADILQHTAPQGDGACAVLLEADSDGAVELEAWGYDLEAHHLGDRDLSRSAGLARAAQRAYRMAGLTDARSDIGRCYWSLRTALQLPLWAEAAAVGSLDQGPAAMPVGRHQIQWAGLPPFAAGLQRLICAVKDLRERPQLGRALVQGCHGPAGQLQAVCLLTRTGGA